MLLCIAAVLVRAIFFAVPMISDEGGYAYIARFWTGDYQLYRDIPFDRPQGIFVLYRLGLALTGPNLVDIRLFAALYSAGTVAAMFLFCHRALSVGEAWLAAGLMAIFSVSPSIEGFTANAETYLNLPVILCAHLTWSRRWFSAGVLAGLAILVKPSGAASVALAGCWALITSPGSLAARRVFAGVVLGVTPALAHGAWIGAHHLWESLVVRRALFYNAYTASLERQIDALTAGLQATVPAWAFLFAASAVGVLHRREAPTGFGLLWLGCTILGMAIGGWWRQHYFIQVIPPLAFLAAIGLAQWKKSSLRPAWAVTLGVTALLFVQRDVALAFRHPDAVSWHLYKRPAYQLSYEIANYVKTNTSPSDRIYVAFADAQIYYLSERVAAAPQLFLLDAMFSRQVFDSILDAIRDQTPSLVIMSSGPPPTMMTSSTFRELLERDYVPVRSFSLVGLERDVRPITAYHRRADRHDADKVDTRVSSVHGSNDVDGSNDNHDQPCDRHQQGGDHQTRHERRRFPRRVPPPNGSEDRGCEQIASQDVDYVVFAEIDDSEAHKQGEAGERNTGGSTESEPREQGAHRRERGMQRRHRGDRVGVEGAMERRQRRVVDAEHHVFNGRDEVQLFRSHPRRNRRDQQVAERAQVARSDHGQRIARKPLSSRVPHHQAEEQKVQEMNTMNGNHHPVEQWRSEVGLQRNGTGRYAEQHAFEIDDVLGVHGTISKLDESIDAPAEGIEERDSRQERQPGPQERTDLATAQRVDRERRDQGVLEDEGVEAVRRCGDVRNGVEHENRHEYDMRPVILIRHATKCSSSGPIGRREQ